MLLHCIGTRARCHWTSAAQSQCWRACVCVCVCVPEMLARVVAWQPHTNPPPPPKQPLLISTMPGPLLSPSPAPAPSAGLAGFYFWFFCFYFFLFFIKWWSCAYFNMAALNFAACVYYDCSRWHCLAPGQHRQQQHQLQLLEWMWMWMEWNGISVGPTLRGHEMCAPYCTSSFIYKSFFLLL